MFCTQDSLNLWQYTQIQVKSACENIDSILNLIGQRKIKEQPNDNVDISYIHKLVVKVSQEIQVLKKLSNSNANDCNDLEIQGKRLNDVSDNIVEQLATFKTQ